MASQAMGVGKKSSSIPKTAKSESVVLFVYFIVNVCFLVFGCINYIQEAGHSIPSFLRIILEVLYFLPAVLLVIHFSQLFVASQPRSKIHAISLGGIIVCSLWFFRMIAGAFGQVYYSSIVLWNLPKLGVGIIFFCLSSLFKNHKRLSRVALWTGIAIAVEYLIGGIVAYCNEPLELFSGEHTVFRFILISDFFAVISLFFITLYLSRFGTIMSGGKTKQTES